MEGFIKLPRSIRNNNIISKSYVHRIIFEYLFFEANFEDTRFEYNKNEIIKKGEIVKTMERMARDINSEFPKINITKNMLFNIINYFIKYEILTCRKIKISKNKVINCYKIIYLETEKKREIINENSSKNTNKHKTEHKRNTNNENIDNNKKNKVIKTELKQNSNRIPNNNKNKEERNNNIIYNGIFNHWLSKKIIIHRNLTDKMIKAIKNALKKYSVEEIKTFIDHYDIILKADYFYKNKYDLDYFLKHKIQYFTENGREWINFLAQKPEFNTVKGEENQKRYNDIAELKNEVKKYIKLGFSEKYIIEEFKRMVKNFKVEIDFNKVKEVINELQS